MNLNTLLEKTSNWDKDERYMATNDLIAELSKDVKIDEIMEKRICSAVLKQLDDQSNDVQSVAVKCLSIILRKVKQAQVVEISDKLINLILEGKDQLRDIYAIGLKNLVNDVPLEIGPVVSQKLISKLLAGITKLENEHIKRECTDILSELLRRFGQHIDLNEVMIVLIHQLESGKQSIKKRVSSCLGSLSIVASDSLLNQLVEIILEKIEKSKHEDQRIFVQTLVAISRTVGYRLGNLVAQLTPIFIRFCGDPTDESQDTEVMNDTRDNCFQGLESLILRCPRESAAFLDEIVDTALTFLKYDPNYSYDEDPSDSGGNMDEDGDIGGDEEEFQGSDDDDTSWKVRKNAVKVIHAIISSYPYISDESFHKFSRELIGCFKEREDSVRCDVITCYAELLAKTFYGVSVNQLRLTDIKNETTQVPILIQYLPSLTDASLKLFTTSSLKTKSASFSMLKIVASVSKSDFEKYLSPFIVCAKTSISDSNQGVKLEALSFLRTVLEMQKSSLEFIPSLLPLVIQSVKADWYKVISEGLRVLDTMITHFPIKSSTTALHDEQTSEMMKNIYSCVAPRLEAQDIDFEIKECAIAICGNLFSRFGDHLLDYVPSILSLLRRRLDNEITRIHALRSLIVIASSPYVQIDMNYFLLEASADLTQLLKQSNRSLKQTALQTIEALLHTKGLLLSPEISTQLRTEIAALLTENDLQHVSLALQTISSAIALVPLSLQPLTPEIYKRIIDLSVSSMIQPAAQTSLVNFISLLITSPGGKDAQSIFSDLKSKCNRPGQISKQSIQTLSKCLACVVSTGTKEFLTNSLTELLNDLKSSPDGIQKQVALCTIGEVGVHKDLLSTSNAYDLIVHCFDSSSEDIKADAAVSLGKIALGNLDVSIPVILKSTNPPKHQYLVLVSLREIIIACANSQKENSFSFQSHVGIIVPTLLRFCDTEEEASRSMVAECLGSLISIQGSGIMSVLTSLGSTAVQEQKYLTLWTVVSAVRFALSKPFVQSTSDLGNVLNEAMILFCPLIQTCPDLEVRRASLLLLNVALHHNFDLVSPHLHQIQPITFEILLLKMERTVDLGPFKHKVDDAAALRIAALACSEEIISVCIKRGLTSLLKLDLLMPSFPSLLTDKDEIRLQAHQIVTKLCHITSSLSNYTDFLIDGFEKALTKKSAVKEGAPSTDIQRSHDVLKSLIACVLTVNKHIDLSYNKRWTVLVDKASQLLPASEIELLKNELQL